MAKLRTPLFPQMEISECGAACLGTVLAHFGRWESMSDLREACRVGRDGSNMADLARAGRRYGLEMDGWTKEIDDLRDMRLPLVLFWEFKHFVVLEHIGKDSWHINDPALGRRTVGPEDFGASFTGVVLEASPRPGFRTGGRPRGVLRNLWPWLRSAKRPLAAAAVLGLLLAVPSLALPLLLASFVDDVLSGGDGQRGLLVLVLAVAAAASTYLLAWMQQRTLRRLAVRIRVIEGERVLSRLFGLPPEFFAQRFAGDLVSRVLLVDSVAGGAAGQLVSILIEMVMSLSFLALMAVLDPLLAAVTAALGAANVVLMQALSRRRSDENRQMRREQALMFGVSAAALRDMDALRATGSEDGFFARWTGYQARELATRQRFAELGHVIGAQPMLFGLLAGTAVLGIGGARVISGESSLGELMGIYLLAASFMAPVGRFVAFADSLQVLDADLQRIDDIRRASPEAAREDVERRPPGSGAGAEPCAGAPEDAGSAQRAVTLGGRLRLTGRIELRDVAFGYQRGRPPLISGISLAVQPGQRIAVVGPTGSGKSTLLKLLSGEHAPWSGEILFDGVPAGEVPREILTSSVALVDQRIFLFAGTIHDNLTMWNPVVADDDVVAAATDALIHDEVVSRVGGYQGAVQEDGRNFSGGQRQRLEIARALAGNPSVLLLDEATSSLDGRSEELIDSGLRRRGCTCIHVAHRLSTIRDSDAILVMDGGRQVQSGTHEELAADTGGLYRRLLAAQ